MKAWGRLTLQSGKARMDENISNNIIYYTPFENDDHMELSLSLSSIKGGNIYDVYLKDNVLVVTAAWNDNSTPSVQRIQRGGLYFNAENDLYLGSVHAIADGTVAWQPKLPPAQYGTNNELGVFNAYNRLSVTAICCDTTAIWTYANSGIRYANNSVNNRIHWLDGTGDVFCEGEYVVSTAGVVNEAAAATVGVGLDQNAYPLTWSGVLSQGAVHSTAEGMQIFGKTCMFGAFGRHNWQAIEETTDVPMQFFGNDFMRLTINLSV